MGAAGRVYLVCAGGSRRIFRGGGKAVAGETRLERRVGPRRLPLHSTLLWRRANGRCLQSGGVG
eukprot:183843-Lingulodinium_polyedra.AAC.1